MNATWFVNKLTMRSFYFIVLTLFILSCSRADPKTLEKLEYWDKQAEIMTLIGPDKTSVFGWVYALDKHAVYKGDSLHAVVEKLPTESKPNRCIKLTIKFDERERVREHIVALENKCQ